MLQSFTHYFLHLLFPLLIAYIFFRKDMWKTWFIFLATMLVDADHLLANPVFDPNRCSIGFHPLHTYWAIAVFVLLLFPRHTRIVAIGLLMHMATDAIDCAWMNCCP